MLIRNNHEHVVKVAGINLGPNREAEIDEARFNAWLDASPVHKYQSQAYLEVVQPAVDTQEPPVETVDPTIDTGDGVETQEPPIETHETPEIPEEATQEALDEEERLAKIRDAVQYLTPENPDHFTKGGIPKLKPLRDYSGLTDITVAERNLALGLDDGGTETDSG